MWERNAEPHRGWIKTLLVDYYDPMYNYQLANVDERVVFKGSYDAVLDWAQTLLAAELPKPA